MRHGSGGEAGVHVPLLQAIVEHDELVRRHPVRGGRWNDAEPHPSDDQGAELSRTFGCVRLVYNRALEARTAAWYGEQRRVSYVQISAMLTDWKQDPGLAFLGEVSSVPLQQGLRHLQAAFAAFWDKRARYPRFTSRKRSRLSAEYTRSAFRWRDGALTLGGRRRP